MQYVFFVSEGTSKYQMDYYKDLRYNPECMFVAPWGSSNKLTKLSRRIISKLNNKLIDTLNNNTFKFSNDIEYCVVVELGYIVNSDRSFFESLRRKENVKLVLLILDSVGASSGVMIKAKHNGVFDYEWDAIFSYDKEDCLKYGWNLFENLYSERPDVKTSKKTSDAYFVGGLKGDRDETILSTYNYLTINGVNCCFDLWNLRGETISDIVQSDGMNVRKFFVPYSKVCSNVKASNCIIEILQKGQHVQTLRWFEAIYYNRKLLTNNIRVKELPYYNPEYIKIFEKPEDIDTKWVKEKIDVDYNYKGDLSIKKLIHLIDEEMACVSKKNK